MKGYRVELSSDAGALPKRIALVRRETPARVLDEPGEVVPTAPHLLLREVVLLQLGLIALAVLSLAFDAPLEGIADPYHTPNPAKAPWYFLGLQELLHYFPPVVAGVLLPGLAVLAIVVIPYFRINLEVVGLYQRPWRRTFRSLSATTLAASALLAAYEVWPVLAVTVIWYALLAAPAWPRCPAGLRRRLEGIPLADWIMAWFVAVATVLTLIGVAFRGPGWEWTWPWRDGIY